VPRRGSVNWFVSTVAATRGFEKARSSNTHRLLTIRLRNIRL
jgi:hypothetical protein